MIHYLPYTKIDKKKWDDCIFNSSNKIVYAYSWYLDMICGEWDALIDGDYKSVMPLTYKKKYGQYYLYVPYGIQQLGIFSKKSIGSDEVAEFIKSIPSKYGYIEINLNTKNIFNGKDIQVKTQLTQELSLNKPYEQLYSLYSENLKRNLKKANKNQLKVIKKIDPELIIKMFSQHKEKEIKNFNKKNYTVLRKIIREYNKNESLQTWGITQNDKLCAGACFAETDGRVIFLFSGALPSSKEIAAMPFLIDCFIQENAGKDKILDFEGSNEPNLARFYKSFGSDELTYSHVRINRLPKLIRWIKK